MKKIKIVALTAAVFFMILTAIYLAGSGSGGSKKKDGYIEVVVASQTIPGNSIITETSLTKISVPEDTVHPNAVRDFKEIVNKMNKSTIYEKEIILKDHIIEKSETDTSPYGLAHVISVGKRGMSIEVSLPQGVAGALKVGNYVDVFYTGDFKYTVFSKPKTSRDDGEAPQKEEIEKHFAKLLLQDIKVVSVGSDITNGSDVSGTQAKPEYKTVTLELTPEEYAKVAFATTRGEVWLGLRSQGDHEKTDFDYVIIDDLIDKTKFIESLKQEFER